MASKAKAATAEAEANTTATEDPDARATRERREKSMAEAVPVRVVVDREVFVERLAFVSAIIPSKAPREHFCCVLLEARDALNGGPALSLTGTSGEVTIVAQMDEVDVQLAGRVLVNAARLGAMVREMTGARVTLTLEPQKSNLRIEHEGARYVLRADDAETFPAAPALGKAGHKLPSAFLAVALQRTAFAAHTERTRYAMAGVAFQVTDKNPGRLSIVATDGKRASWVEVDAPGAAPLTAVVPVVAVQAMIRVFERWTDEAVEFGPVSWGEEGSVSTAAALQFRTRLVTVTARLVEGSFPPWEGVPMWKAPRTGRLDVARAVLSCGLRQVAVVADKVTNVSRWNLTREGLRMTLRQGSGDEADIDVPATFEGDPCVTGYQSGYVADAIRLLGEQLALEFVPADKGATAFRAEGSVPGVPDGCRAVWVYLVMPVALT